MMNFSSRRARLFASASTAAALFASCMMTSGQSDKVARHVPEASQRTRYFQLEMVVRYPTGTEDQPRSQSLLTDVAVDPDRPGHCRMRMGSQVPLVMSGTTKFVDVGTKLDCNNIRVDGDALTLSFVLETSFLTGTVTTKNSAGAETEEPTISQRTVELAARVPLGTPKIVFDSKSIDPRAMKRAELSGQAMPTGGAKQMDATALQIEMTAKELK